MRKATKCCCLLCAAALLLTGCGGKTIAPSASVTLPPPEVKAAAPENDSAQTYAQSVSLYLPSRDGTRLIAVPETAELSLSRPSAQALCQLLLAHPGTENAAPVGGDVALSLSGTEAVEVSGRVATVSLGASALRLSYEQLFAVGQALANTLCQFGDVEYVNLLISGVQPGLNVAATLPAGCFQQNTRENLSTLWARASAPQTGTRRALVAALYYPAPGGKGVLCEAQTLAFADLNPGPVMTTLLDALSAGAETLSGVPQYPGLTALLTKEPTVSETNGSRRAVLHFDASLNDQLLAAGITRSVMVASLVYTLTTFLPGIEGVELHIGSEKITTLTPSGTYLNAGETMNFPDGLMRRSDFSAFLLTPCTLYFASGEGKLRQAVRAVPFYEGCSVRAIVGQLMQGPQPYDSPSGLSAALPEGLRDADLLGVSYENGVVMLNFSSQLITKCQGFSPAQERQMVYSLVNTLTQLPGVRRVCFFILGDQPQSFAGALYLPGDFMPNLDLIEN